MTRKKRLEQLHNKMLLTKAQKKVIQHSTKKFIIQKPKESFINTDSKCIISSIEETNTNNTNPTPNSQ